MDGNYPGTIEKLCLELPDVDKFRPIHQLDFATSGVLLVGISKAAAARARKAFDSGRVRKCYVALLEVGSVILLKSVVMSGCSSASGKRQDPKHVQYGPAWSHNNSRGQGEMTESEIFIDEPISSYEGPATLPPRGEPGTHRGARDFRMMVGGGGGCISLSVPVCL